MDPASYQCTFNRYDEHELIDIVITRVLCAAMMQDHWDRERIQCADDIIWGCSNTLFREMAIFESRWGNEPWSLWGKMTTMNERVADATHSYILRLSQAQRNHVTQVREISVAVATRNWRNFFGQQDFRMQMFEVRACWTLLTLVESSLSSWWVTAVVGKTKISFVIDLCAELLSNELSAMGWFDGVVKVVMVKVRQCF